MKKFLALAIAILLVLAMTVPVAAADVTTTVSTSGSGSPPVVKAKWETGESNLDSAGAPAPYFDWDVNDDDPLTQIRPPTAYQDNAWVDVYVIAGDTKAWYVASVDGVIYHPDQPLLGEDPGVARSYKDNLMFEPWEVTPGTNPLADAALSAAEIAAAKAKIDEAIAAGVLVLPMTDYDRAEIFLELDQQQCWIWHVAYQMSYHQPAGIYDIEAWATDLDQNLSGIFENSFEYVAATGLELDFSSIDYGDLNWESSPNPAGGTENNFAGYAGGDFTFGGLLPTLRNIGNTWLNVQIRQDDMGFGRNTQTETWKVYYDAKVGSTTEYPNNGSADPTNFYPAVTKVPGLSSLGADAGWTELPGDVHLCNTWKLDFSIHIRQLGTGSPYTGLMQIRADYLPFNGLQIDHPGTTTPS